MTTEGIAGGGILPNSQTGTIESPDRRSTSSAETKSVFGKIKNFFCRVIGGRIGAKAGHHSLGGFIKIGLGHKGGSLKSIAKKEAVPPHSYSFKELPPGKARELLPWVGAAKFSNGRCPISLSSSQMNIGKKLHTEHIKEMELSEVKNPARLDADVQKLLEGLKGICSDEAHITRSGAIEDPKTGLRATISKDPDHPDRYIVGFGCTGGVEEQHGTAGKKRQKKTIRKQDEANFIQYLGLEPKVYKQARQLVGLAAGLWGKDKISTTGHSLGGGLAQYAGLYNGVSAKCFNASPLGVGLQQILGDKIEGANSLVEHFSMRGDWLSHSAASLPIGLVKHKYSPATGQDTRPRILSHLADLLGIRTRGNFGVKYYINFDETANKADIEKRIRNLTEEKLKGKKGDQETSGPMKERLNRGIEKKTNRILKGKIKRSKDPNWRHRQILEELSLMGRPKVDTAESGHV